ncbi:MAG TPA: FtsQ-type POTRA domain-containing protein [Armatimonadota bacterium]
MINYRRLALIIVVTVFFVVSISSLLSSPYFFISKVRVVGTKTIPQSAIKKCVKLPVDQNIFLLHKRPIEQRVLANQVVQEVRLYRKLPDSLTVRIVERKAAFILDTGSAKFDIDSRGVPFRTTSLAKPGVPVISYAMAKSPVLGRPITRSSFTGAMEAIVLAREKGLAGAGKITVDQNNDLCLNVSDKYEVRLGQPDRLSTKLDITVDMLRILGSDENLEYFDVACPEAAVYKPRTGARTAAR